MEKGEGEAEGKVFNSKGEVVIAKAGAIERGEVISKTRELKFIDAGAAQNVAYVIIRSKNTPKRLSCVTTKSGVFFHSGSTMPVLFARIVVNLGITGG